jgi:hypothetical protein
LFIPDPDADFLPIPDPGVKKAPDPGSGSATLPSTVFCLVLTALNSSFRSVCTFISQQLLFQQFILYFVSVSGIRWAGAFMVVFARKSDEYSIVLLLSKLKMTDPDPQKIMMV